MPDEQVIRFVLEEDTGQQVPRPGGGPSAPTRPPSLLEGTDRPPSRAVIPYPEDPSKMPRGIPVAQRPPGAGPIQAGIPPGSDVMREMLDVLQSIRDEGAGQAPPKGPPPPKPPGPPGPPEGEAQGGLLRRGLMGLGRMGFQSLGPAAAAGVGAATESPMLGTAAGVAGQMVGRIGMAMGPVGAVFGGIAAAGIGLVKVFGSMAQASRELRDELGGLAPEVAAERARGRAEMMQLRMRIARERGPEMAEAERSSQRLERAKLDWKAAWASTGIEKFFNDFKTGILTQLTKLVGGQTEQDRLLEDVKTLLANGTDEQKKAIREQLEKMEEIAKGSNSMIGVVGELKKANDTLKKLVERAAKEAAANIPFLDPGFPGVEVGEFAPRNLPEGVGGGI